MARNRKKRKSGKKGRQGLPLLLLLLLLALILTVRQTRTEAPAGETSAPSGQTSAAEPALTVYYLDVGQGDCELLESGGEYVLIDAGGDGNHKESVQTFLSQLGVEELDYVIATHPHADHIQEMADIIGTYDIGTFFLPDVTASTAVFEKMLDALESRSVQVESPAPGDTFTFGSCTAQVLGPIEIDEENLNACSIVLRVTCGETAFLFTGDCTASEEAEILEWLGNSSAGLRADVLKVGHHGSSTSTSEGFLAAVSPGRAVISCGADNSYGHPHQEVVDALNQIQAEIYRTDTMGTVTARSDGQTIRFTTEKEDTP